ncbi:MAG: hypothetical protein IT338_03600 [Thermomicrobiales bacterium]|nr:hypothetical protein [Thermomicrobiales bacterium]
MAGWRSRIGPRTVIVMLLSVECVASSGASVLAQATPTPAALDVPAPDDCQIAPRALPLFPPGVGQRTAATPRPLASPAAGPAVVAVGAPADAETAAAVTATVREALACRNAGDFPRAYALFTQQMLIQLFGGPATIDPEIQAAMSEKPHHLPRGQRIGLVSLEQATIMPDGRVAAIVTTATPRRLFRDRLVFAHDSATGRWLIDEARGMGG